MVLWWQGGLQFSGGSVVFWCKVGVLELLEK